MIARPHGPSWPGLLASSFAPALPGPALQLFNRLVSGRRGAAGGIALLRPEWQEEIEAAAAGKARNIQGERTNRELRWRILRTSDAGNFRKRALGRWGVDERDPTADHRLAEFCFSLPPDQLLENGVNRRLARLALSDRIPASILDGPRGYQYADWYENINRAALDRMIAGLEPALGDGSVIDLQQLRGLAASWPDRDWASPAVIGTYRIMLLRALAAAAFEADFRQ
jgi:asparagine synthase (glutamine-hydrolysing)